MRAAGRAAPSPAPRSSAPARRRHDLPPSGIATREAERLLPGHSPCGGEAMLSKKYMQNDEDRDAYIDSPAWPEDEDGDENAHIDSPDYLLDDHDDEDQDENAHVDPSDWLDDEDQDENAHIDSPDYQLDDH